MFGIIDPILKYYSNIRVIQNLGNHYKVTGKERDSESGLDYFGGSYYGSNMGRFMSQDWSEDPIPSLSRI